MNNFDSIYKDNYSKMYNLAYKMVNDGEVVNDILQDIFAFYFEKTESGYRIQYPSSWLYRATINKCIDYNGKGRKREDSQINNGITENNIENDQKKEIVRKALDRLKPQEKSLAILYGEGFSYREMAEITGIGFSSIGKTLSRTLKKMKEILKSMNYELY